MGRKIVAAFAVVASVVIAGCGSSSSTKAKSDTEQAKPAKVSTVEKASPVSPETCSGSVGGGEGAGGAPIPSADTIVAIGMTCDQAKAIATSATKDPTSGCLAKSGVSCTNDRAACVSKAGDVNDGGDYVAVTCRVDTATATFKLYYA